MKKSTRFNVLIALTYSITLIGGMYFGYKFLKDQGLVMGSYKPHAANHTAKKVEEIIHIINKNYVDEVNADSLQHLPIDSLLHELDPHSLYLPADKAFEMAETLEGNFEGIGVEYYILNDTLLVTHVLKDGPAFFAGVKQGDKILKVDSAIVSGKSLPRSAMIGKIKGKKGTLVQLTIARNGLNAPAVFSIKRGRVSVSSIDAAYLLNPEIGYIRIGKFGANTEEDFVAMVKLLKAKGMKKMVLDLRDNGGGYLNAATALANQFLPENKLIVYTEGKHEPRTDYFSTGKGEFAQGKLAVLINENSASASEIFAGAIQDLDRGTIIGRRSFGKGLVQEQFSFDDGSALNLTIARYYTPLGRNIQKPYKNGYAAYQNQIADKQNDEQVIPKFKNKDSVNKMPVYLTKSGKKVYGGGGIQPDIYVKLDTNGYNKFYVTLVDKKILSDFVLDVLTDKYNSTYIAQNLNSFSVGEADFKDLIKYIQQKNVAIDYKQLVAAKLLITNDLKIMLCRYYLGDVGFYKAYNQNDPMIKQALNSLQ